MQVLICFYSLYGHIFTLANAMAEGVATTGCIPVLKTVAETLSPEVLEKMSAASDSQRGADLPIATPEDLVKAGGIIFGSPTRFGCMCGQMRTFLDMTGGLLARQALAGKIGSTFTATATQHGGQETTNLSFHTYMLHHSMLIAGAPFGHMGLNRIDEMSGGSPYGAGCIAGADGSRRPSVNELEIAKAQGEFVASFVKKLAS